MGNNDRMEATPPQPLKRGECDWCGSKPPQGLVYCNSECRTNYNNLLAKQGKAIMQRLKHWRYHRGKAGTPGAGVFTDLALRVDEMMKRDKQRKDEMKDQRDLDAKPR